MFGVSVERTFEQILGRGNVWRGLRAHLEAN
jgi:hypothetical protein